MYKSTIRFDEPDITAITEGATDQDAIAIAALATWFKLSTPISFLWLAFGENPSNR
jgi:hypothetical protein